MGKRTRRSPARFLAPLALIAVLIVLLSIVSGSGGGSDSSSSSDPATTTTKKAATKSTTAAGKKSTTKKTVTKKTYIVQPGDSFGAIATKTGITVEQLQALNPDADSRLLQTGQTLRVK
jgi:LysM repeat protein